MARPLSRRARLVCVAAGAAVALAATWVGWQLLWAEAVEQAYSRRWQEEP